jgi:hypothetical protein
MFWVKAAQRRWLLDELFVNETSSMEETAHFMGCAVDGRASQHDSTEVLKPI